MNNRQSTIPENINHRLDPGWAIRIYSGDRRLLFSLDPSHGWTCLLGILLGIVFTLSYGRFVPAEPAPQPPVDPPTEIEALNAPLQID